MTQRALAELFAVGIPAINKHLKNIYETGELDPDSTLSKMEIVRPRRRVEAASCRFHNLLKTDNSSAIVSKFWNKVAAASRRRFPSIPQRRDASATLFHNS